MTAAHRRPFNQAATFVNGATNTVTTAPHNAVTSITDVPVFVALFTNVTAWLKERRWAAVIGWLGWVLAMFVLFFPIRLLEDEPTGVWLVENFRSVKTVASLTAVVFLAISLLVAVRLAKPSSWWAQRRYREEKYEKSVERHGWAKIKAR